MNVIHYNPLALLDQLQRRHFGTLQTGVQEDSAIDTCSWQPACDIQETPTHFVIHADLPGVPTKDIKISMENNILSLQGERGSESKKSDKNFTRVERTYGSFYRRFSLPSTADSTRVSAVSKHGVLEIKIAKKELAQPRTIEIEEHSN